MTIKAVAFDFGGVIEIGGGASPLELASQILGVPLDDFRNAYFKQNHLSNVHNLPWEDMFTKVIAEFSDDSEIENKVRAAIRESTLQRKINTDLVALFPILKRQGLKVGILSNATSGLREKLKKHDILGSVDEVVISGEIGFQKPHKEAFEALLDRLHVHSHEAVFIDDSTKSLEKAEEIGYIPILFKDNAQLKMALKGLGIAVA